MVRAVPTARSKPYLRSLLSYAGLFEKLRSAEDSIMEIRGSLMQAEKELLANLIWCGGDQPVENRSLAPGLRVIIPAVIQQALCGKYYFSLGYSITVCQVEENPTRSTLSTPPGLLRSHEETSRCRGVHYTDKDKHA